MHYISRYIVQHLIHSVGRLPVTDGGQGFKYKVSLETRGRVLVSGHHLAFEDAAPLQSLHVGARVVTSYRKDNKAFFYSGILGELPSGRNHMR